MVIKEVGNKTKKFLYNPEIEGEAIKNILQEISNSLPSIREYRMSKEVKSTQEKSPSKLISNYGHFLKTHPKYLLMDAATIISTTSATSTGYVLSEPTISGKLLHEGKIWDGVTFVPPNKGPLATPKDTPYMWGSRYPNASDILSLASIPIAIALWVGEGVRYYRHKKSTQ